MESTRNHRAEPEMIEIEQISKKPKTSKKSKTPNPPKANISALYNNILNTLKEKISVVEIRSSTIHLIIKYVMEEIEDSPLKGSEQKEMALKLIKGLIIDLTENEDEQALLKLLNDGTISNLIDLIVDASKGRLNINTVTQVTTGCLNTCLPYLFSKKK